MTSKTNGNVQHVSGSGTLIRNPPGFEAVVAYSIEAWRWLLEGEHPGGWGYELFLTARPPNQNLVRFTGSVNGEQVPVFLRLEGHEAEITIAQGMARRTPAHFREDADAVLKRLFPAIFPGG